ncbi:hypothetical protein AB1M95_13745 [Sulfitobacter sp. LCG007]
MLIFLDAGLAYLATPKTGTTAIENALRSHADIVFAGQGKHMTARRFQRRIAPFVEKTFGVRLESVAVMRDPLDQLQSWYRYRAGDRQKGTDRSTADMSFDAFLRDVLSDSPPPHADIGNQLRFLNVGRDGASVDHLFAYESPDALCAFLSDKLGTRIVTERHNVSPRVDATVSVEMEQRLRRARAADFALHRRLVAAGGYLRGTS